ncbi:MAG: YidC/Oxa1 family membrane protein insertase [Candidatus Pacebacteria bacterium]|nr:YidC/Oxa1 family membrane protein insertase [Candidatus Paceibacterota bacterium]
MPDYSIFISVIILTIIVRLIISPLSYKSIKTQLQTKLLQPKLDKIKKEVANKQEQAKLTLELYKKHGVNPFSSFFVMLIQLPIILALYWVFKDISDGINLEILYSFISIPEKLNLISFGFDLSEKSYILAFLTGFTQYIYLSFSSSMKSTGEDSEKSEQAKMMAMVGKSMKYTMPVIITVFSYIIGGAVALYWVASNVFMIFQELYIQKKLKNKKTT